MSQVLSKERSDSFAPPSKVFYHPLTVEQAGNRLRQAILDACHAFENSSTSGSKDYLRALHGKAKSDEPGVDGFKVRALFQKYQKYFRNGSEICPEKIAPTMKLAIVGSEWADLFVVVRALWSMPYSKGYGRRLRFVIFDEYHQAVIGIVGLQSPPADLGCRDRLFDYPVNAKLAMVNYTMDAFSIGAIPPYSFLLGGKLCAGLVASDNVRQAYWSQYAGKKTLMDGVQIQQPLVGVTTTSAFGKSSMYNRLRFGQRLLARPIGYTMGYGTLHLEHLYGDVRRYLEMTDKYNAGGFGTGPKVRWQNLMNALQELGLPGDLLRHGVKREVYLYSFVSALEDGMAGGEFGAPISMTLSEYSDYWLDRWALPRAARFPHWKNGDTKALLKQTLDSIASKKRVDCDI